MNEDFVMDFDDVDNTTAEVEQANDGATTNNAEKPAAVDPEVLAEAIANALIRAQGAAAVQQPVEPQRDPAEVELEDLRRRIAEIDQKISELTLSNPEHPQIGQLILEKESLRGRIGDIEATLPLKRQMSQIEERMQLVQRIPFRVDQLVAGVEPALAKFGDKANELRMQLRAELAEAAQRDPVTFFDDATMTRVIRAWIGEKAYSFGMLDAPYNPSNNPPADGGEGSDIERRRWEKAIRTIGLNPERVLGGNNA